MSFLVYERLVECPAYPEDLWDRCYLNSQHPIYPVPLFPGETIQTLRDHLGHVFH